MSNIGVVYAEQGDKAKAIFFQQSIQAKESIQQDIVGEFKPITRLSKDAYLNLIDLLALEKDMRKPSITPNDHGRVLHSTNSAIDG